MGWLARALGLEQETLQRSEAFDAQVEAFWDSLRGWGFSPRMIENIWVTARCLQLCCQQICSMPLRFTGGSETAREPAWVSSPDPVWFPNGIGDCVFAAMDNMYRWGDAFLIVTSRYADGLPQQWTVADSARITVELGTRGRRTYRIDETPLPAGDVVQVSRDPRGQLRGTSVFQAYGPQMVGALAQSDLTRAIQEGGVPVAVIKSAKKITPDQAQAIQNAWALATASRRGTPAVLGPDLDYTPLSFSPEDMELLASQEFNARVLASALSVPPHMVNLPLTGGLTYQNPAMLFEQWWRAELWPASLRLSRAMTSQMLQRGSEVNFDPLLSQTGEFLQAEVGSPVAAVSPTQQNGTGVIQALRPISGVM